MDYDIQHDEINHQFILSLDGKMAKLKYSILPDGKTLDYSSTFVPPELRGKKIGEELVLYALNYAKENQYKIIPSCPFVQRVMERNPRYLILNWRIV